MAIMPQEEAEIRGQFIDQKTGFPMQVTLRSKAGIDNMKLRYLSAKCPERWGQAALNGTAIPTGTVDNEVRIQMEVIDPATQLPEELKDKQITDGSS